MKCLVTSDKHDPELDAVCEEWESRGGKVFRLGKFWIPDPEVSQSQIAIYGSLAFSMVVAQVYGVELVSPDDSTIASLPWKWLKRTIAIRSIADLSETDFPVFMKPVQPKLFLASIFNSKADFDNATRGVDTHSLCLVSEIIPDIQCEARCFIKDGSVLDSSLYEGEEDQALLMEFADLFASEHSHILPRTYVADFGFSPTRGWFVIEFNASWGAGLNGCFAAKVWEAIDLATFDPLSEQT